MPHNVKSGTGPSQASENLHGCTELGRVCICISLQHSARSAHEHCTSTSIIGYVATDIKRTRDMSQV